MNFKDFFNECNEKKVFKNLSIYVVSSWVLIQVFAILWEPFGLPKISMTYLLLILLVGFPLYMYLLWKYRLKSLEVEIPSSPAKVEPPKKESSKTGTKLEGTLGETLVGIPFKNTFHRMYFTFLLVITLLVVFSASLIVKAKFDRSSEVNMAFSTPEGIDSNKIAVLPFENNTMDEQLEVVGKMAVDWIMNGITKNRIAQVISPKIIDEYSNVLKASAKPSDEKGVLTEYFKPSKIINGSYYLSQGKLLFQCTILDKNLNKTLISFDPVDCDPEAPLDCIEALKQKVLGYLVTANSSSMGFEENPPNYEAYQLLLEARSKYSHTDPKYLSLINQAIAVDSTFYELKLERLEYYYNRDQFAVADSLFQILSKESGSNKRQLNILNYHEALLNGDNRNAYKYFMNEYEIEPFVLENNSAAMVLALQFVNRPEEIETFYRALSMEDMDFEKCRLCEFRVYIMSLALLEQGNPDGVIELTKPFAKIPGYEWIKEALLSAYIVKGNQKAVDDLMDYIQLTSERERWYSLSLFCGKEYLVAGNQEAAKAYFEGLIQAINHNRQILSKKELELLPKAHYYNGEYKKVVTWFEQSEDTFEDPEMISYRFISSSKLGNPERAMEQLNTLNSLRAPYQYGNIDYCLARYYSVQGDDKKALDYLLKSVAAGKRYIPGTFQHDIHFKKYVGSEPFNHIMSFWK